MKFENLKGVLNISNCFAIKFDDICSKIESSDYNNII